MMVKPGFKKELLSR